MGFDEGLGSVSDSFEETVRAVLQECGDILIQKHHDYGPKNISHSPGGPLNGIRVRMWDKVARINNLLDSGSEPKVESLRDSFLDIANYGAIALMCIDGSWPGVEKTGSANV